jgi:cell division protein FtsB
MNNKQIKNRLLVKFFYNSRFIFALALAVILILSFPIVKNFSQRDKAAKEIKELEKEIESIGNKNEELRQLVDYLNSDQYLEGQARLNFGLKKPGEETAVIEMDGENKDNRSGNADQKSVYIMPGLEEKNNSKPLTNTQKWLNYFFKK